MILLYGADTANVIKEEIESMLKSLNGYTPTLGIVRIGANPADLSYEKGAIKKMESLSLNTKVFEFDESISSDEFWDEFDDPDFTPNCARILFPTS